MEARLQFAVIGVGHWGPNIVRALTDGARNDVRWVVDSRPERLEQVRQRYPWTQVTTNPIDALDDPAVDAVVIATPAKTHFDLACSALHRGKHVLVEKPLTDSIDTAQKLVAISDESDRVLMVGHTFLYNRGIQRVKEYVDQGRLGNIYYIAMTRTNLGPIRTDVSAAWDLAAHDVSIANYWLASLPLSVVAVGGSWINPGLEDVVLATLKYPNGVLVNIHTSWLNPRKFREITVVGDAHMLTFDDLNLSEPIRLFDKSVVAADDGFVDSYQAFRSSVREGSIVSPWVPLEEPLRTEISHFTDSILSGTTPLTDARNGRDVVLVLSAIAQSMTSGGREEHVEDSVATASLSNKEA
jgi:predicted dehydrogenase